MKDKTVLEMYLEDMKSISPIEEDERKKLIEAFLKGDKGAKNRLIEGHLMYAAGFIQPFLGQNQEVSDLICESHLALTLAVNEYKSGDLKLQIKEKIEERLKEFTKAEGLAGNTSKELVQRINDLMEISRTLAQELGREPEIDEIANRLSIPREEVEELLKISTNALGI